METPTVQLLATLELQIQTLVSKMTTLQQANQDLTKQLAETLSKLETKQEATRSWQEKYEALKSAQGINAGDVAAKKRALHHIDALINEVDACIAQLEIDE